MKTEEFPLQVVTVFKRRAEAINEPEQKLWLGVLTQATLDALKDLPSVPQNPKAHANARRFAERVKNVRAMHRERQEARKWLLSDGVEYCCDAIGLHPSFVRRVLIEHTGIANVQAA